MTSPAAEYASPMASGVADTQAAFAAGMRANDARMAAAGDPMGGAVSLPVPPAEELEQPWVPEQPGDGGGVT